MSSVTAWTRRVTALIVWDWAADCSRLVVLRRQRSCLQNCCASDWQGVSECRQNAVVWHGHRQQADSYQPGNLGHCRTRTGTPVDTTCCHTRSQCSWQSRSEIWSHRLVSVTSPALSLATFFRENFCYWLKRSVYMVTAFLQSCQCYAAVNGQSKQILSQLTSNYTWHGKWLWMGVEHEVVNTITLLGVISPMMCT